MGRSNGHARSVFSPSEQTVQPMRGGVEFGERERNWSSATWAAPGDRPRHPVRAGATEQAWAVSNR